MLKIVPARQVYGPLESKPVRLESAQITALVNTLLDSAAMKLSILNFAQMYKKMGRESLKEFGETQSALYGGEGKEQCDALMV